MCLHDFAISGKCSWRSTSHSAEYYAPPIGSALCPSGDRVLLRSRRPPGSSQLLGQGHRRRRPGQAAQYRPRFRTYPEDIIRVAQEMGAEAQMKENLTFRGGECLCQSGDPVIVDCQSWRSPSSGNLTWSDDYGDGHWMVVVGMDGKNVYLEDPYILGSKGFIPRQELEERGDCLKRLGQLGWALSSSRNLLCYIIICNLQLSISLQHKHQDCFECML